MFAWLLVVDEFESLVCHLHLEVLIALCVCEINGSPLVCGVIQRILLPSNKNRAEQALTNMDESKFYILLCTLMMDITGCEFRSVNSSKRNRWQNLDKSLWNGTALGRQQIVTYLCFVKLQFVTLQGETNHNEQRPQKMFTVNTQRAKFCSKEELGVIKLGLVQGTFGLQLSAWMAGYSVS